MIFLLGSDTSTKQILVPDWDAFQMRLLSFSIALGMTGHGTMQEVETKMAVYIRLLAERFKHIRSITEVKELDLLIRTEIHKEQSEDPSKGFYKLLDAKVMGPTGEARMSYMMSSILMHTVGGRKRQIDEATGGTPGPTNSPLTDEQKKLRNKEKSDARKVRKQNAKNGDPRNADGKNNGDPKRKPPMGQQQKYPAAEHKQLLAWSKDPKNYRLCRHFNASTGCKDADCQFIAKCMKCGDTAHGAFLCRR